MLEDKTWCVNPDCPFTECDDNIRKLKGHKGMVSMANFGGVCRKYIAWLVVLVNAEKHIEESEAAVKDEV